jgi:serine/threonine protein kinase
MIRPAMIDLPPRYKPIKELAGGGMSDTWLCSDENLKRNVVVKTLKIGVARSKLLDELSALSAIRSKHVVQVLDVIRDKKGEVCGFVEEFIEGSALTCVPVHDAPTAMRKLYPIACGVTDIHAHGRLHRDLKPDNMKLDKEGTLKIFDFGLAKLEKSDGTSVLYFSQGFTAPEAFKKDAKGAHVYSYAIDVFAFGAIALWLLNEGQLPSEFYDVPPTVPHAGCDFSGLPCSLPPPVSEMLNATLLTDAAARPAMISVRDVLKRHLLHDRHRMLLTFAGQDYWLDANRRRTNLSFMDASISIEYDGLDFRVAALTGYVQINNKVAEVGMMLSGAAVIVLNAASGGRRSVTADVSHPEVMA